MEHPVRIDVERRRRRRRFRLAERRSPAGSDAPAHAVEHAERARCARRTRGRTMRRPLYISATRHPRLKHAARLEPERALSSNVQRDEPVVGQHGRASLARAAARSFAHACGAGAHLDGRRRPPPFEQPQLGSDSCAPFATFRQLVLGVENRTPSRRTGSSAARSFEVSVSRLTHSSSASSPSSVRSSAATCRQLSATPGVAGERADVGALRHSERHVPRGKPRRRPRHAQQPRIVHTDVARREVDDVAARGFAGLLFPFTLMAEYTPAASGLASAHEATNAAANSIEHAVGHLARARTLAGGVVGVGAGTERDGHAIALVARSDTTPDAWPARRRWEARR